MIDEKIMKVLELQLILMMPTIEKDISSVNEFMIDKTNSVKKLNI